MIVAALQALPDYMVKADLFDKGSNRMWSPGDRFRMYFGGRAGSKQGALPGATCRVPPSGTWQLCQTVVGGMVLGDSVQTLPHLVN